ncbi:MAG: hypothetical protein BIFFINMI_01183 [Phycisphaerae bacterium]|nr:hypothetical protein [Phycisphaerae bacterium]
MRLVMAVAVVCVLSVSTLLRAADPPPLVQSPKVLTDGTVDTSSAKAIADHFFKDRPGVSDEQKVLEFYHWFRRVVYPFRNMGGDRRCVTKAINTAGCSLCGSQAGLVLAILHEGGYEVRVANGNGGKEWGHTFWEVKYDGGWHLFDAMTAFYVRVRTADGKPGHIASAEEIEADPTLVTKAQEEGRCGPEFLYSMRNHEITLEEREQFQSETKGQDVPWSLLVTKPGSLLDFWTAIATRKKISVGAENNLNGGHDEAGVLDIPLKANETYVRLWEGTGKWLIAPSFDKYPPANMSAGGNEHFDVVNFKYFEPYRREKPNPFNDAIYRAYGNGWLQWQPADGAQLRQGVDAGMTRGLDIADDGGVKLAEGSKNGALLLPVKSPYGVVEATLELAIRQGEGATTTVMVMAGVRGSDGKLRYRAAEKVAEVTGQAERVETAVKSFALANPSVYEFAWEIRTTGDASATLRVKRVHTLFQCNPMALPGLLPGANKVHVSAAAADTLAAGWVLAVTYDWAEGKDWKTSKSDTQRLARLPADYAVKVDDSTGKLPKMVKLVVSLEPVGRKE